MRNFILTFIEYGWFLPLALSSFVDGFVGIPHTKMLPPPQKRDCHPKQLSIFQPR